MKLCDCKNKSECKFSIVRNAGNKLFDLCQTSEEHREAFGGMSQKVPEKRVRGLGDVVSKTIQKATGGRVKPCAPCKKREAALNHLFSAKYVPVEAVPYGGPVRRNLIYHVWPNGDRWKWNIDHLMKGWEQFNGRKRIGIAVSRDGDEDKVRAMFPDDTEFTVSENSKKMGEMVHFIDLLESMESMDPRDITMYCHAKGAKYREIRKGHEGLVMWIEAMYDLLLHYPEVIEQNLVDKGMCGVFSMTAKFRGLARRLEHHFSGTFYWFRNCHVYHRNWRYTQNDYYGSEMWPGFQFKCEDISSLVPIPKGKIFHMYKADFWERYLTPRVEKWRSENQKYRVDW